MDKIYYIQVSGSPEPNLYFKNFKDARDVLINELGATKEALNGVTQDWADIAEEWTYKAKYFDYTLGSIKLR